MPRYLVGLCILTSSLIYQVAARQPASAPLPFTFKVGQSVWLEAHELPIRFEGILLRVMALGDSIETGGIAILHHGPILVCGDMEQVLLVGSTFQLITSRPRPDEGAGLQKAIPDRPRTERPPLDSSLVTAPIWRVFPAPLVKNALVVGFEKQKKCKIADSTEAADFVFWILAVPALELRPSGAADRNAPFLSSALALAIPREHFSRKQAEFQLLAVPPIEETSISWPQKQRQLYDLMKDVPWEGVALGLGRGIALKKGNAEVSFTDLIQCFHKEAKQLNKGKAFLR